MNIIKSIISLYDLQYVTYTLIIIDSIIYIIEKIKEHKGN